MATPAAELATPAAALPRRLLAGAVATILVSSVIVGTLSWLANVTTGQSAWGALQRWLAAWGAFAIFAAVVTVPAVLLFGWPLDHFTRRRPPLLTALVFGWLGLVVGALTGYAIVAPLGSGLAGAAVVAPVGEVAAFAGRLLVEPVARRGWLLLTLTAATVGLVALGVASW